MIENAIKRDDTYRIDVHISSESTRRPSTCALRVVHRGSFARGGGYPEQEVGDDKDNRLVSDLQRTR